MRSLFISALSLMAAFASIAQATDLELKVTSLSGASSETIDSNCTTVRYMITGKLSSATDNDGLALWTCDLSLTGPPGVTLPALPPLDHPNPVSDLANFDIPLGIANPPIASGAGLSGYGGTPDPANSSVLLGLGGAINTIHNPGSTAAPYPNAPGVMEKFAWSERTLALGTVVLPSTAGVYTISISNPVANVIRLNEPSDPNGEYHRTEAVGTITTSALTITVATPVRGGMLIAANPYLAADNPWRPGLPFRDVLQNTTATLVPQGIGVAGTPAEGPVVYSPVHITFSCAPGTIPTPQNITVTCTGGTCPTVTTVASGPGAFEYQLTLSGQIPTKQCTTFTFMGVAEKLQYQFLPGDVNLDGTTNTQDLLALYAALNGGANLAANIARYDIDRSSTGAALVNTQDALRLVQLLNGTSSTQVWNGATVAACP